MSYPPTNTQGASETSSSPLDVTMLAMLGLTMAGAGVMKSQSAQKKQQELAQANAVAQAQLATAKAQQAQTASANWAENQAMQASATKKVYTKVQQSQANIDFWASYVAWKIKVAEAEEKRRQAELEARVKAYYAALRLRPVSSQPVESMPVLGLLKGLLTGAKILGQGIKMVNKIVKTITEKNGATGASGFVSGTGGAGGGSSIRRGQEDDDEICNSPFVLLPYSICTMVTNPDRIDQATTAINSTVAINIVDSNGNVHAQSLGVMVNINGQEFISTHDHFGSHQSSIYDNSCSFLSYLQQYSYIVIDGNLGQTSIPVSQIQSACIPNTGVQLIGQVNGTPFGVTSSYSQISPSCNLNIGDSISFVHVPDWNGNSLDNSGYQLSSNTILSTNTLIQISPNYVIMHAQGGLGDSGGGLYDQNFNLCGHLGFNTPMLRGNDNDKIVVEPFGLNTILDTACNLGYSLDTNAYHDEAPCRYNIFYPIR